MSFTSKSMPFDIKALEVFLAVCDGGGMAPAARQLGLTQPSVSQRIQELETNLGIRLFDRSIRPMTLTSAGAVLRQRAAALVAEASSIAPMLQQIGKMRLPILRIGMIDSLTRILTSNLCEHLSPHSEHLSILSGHTSSHLNDLVVRKLDIFMGASQLEAIDRLERRDIVEEPYIIACPKAVTAPKSIEDLVELAKKLPLLRFSSRSMMGLEIETHLRRLRVDIPTRLEFDTSDCLAAAMTSGNGWAITTPLCAYQGQLDQGSFRYHPLPGPSFIRKITLISRARELGGLPRQIATEARGILISKLTPFSEAAMPWVRFTDQ